LRSAGGRAIKTTVEQTLMRGLRPHFRVFVRGCLDLPAGVNKGSLATQFVRGFPTEALPSALRNRRCQILIALRNNHAVGWPHAAMRGWTSRPMAHRNAAISRAIAVVTTVWRLPAAISRR
jgi:hypothetical protein